MSHIYNFFFARLKEELIQYEIITSLGNNQNVDVAINKTVGALRTIYLCYSFPSFLMIINVDGVFRYIKRRLYI